ncbi:hypothetical protein [Streptomyces sp. KR55]|uniref:hypothetical protein n=1 Tax=Streptomyces sp. KR55 TaxID=3457425 RepID=UPI003FD16320
MAWSSGLRGMRVGWLPVAAASVALALTTSPAVAAGASATGPEGQKLTVSKASGLDPAG